MKRSRWILTGFLPLVLLACGPKEVNEICNNNQDDDNDTFVDCLDADCQDDPACQNNDNEICNNTLDDDQDGQIDCNDTDCQTDPSCQAEICDNQIDDNQNGQIDCQEQTCIGTPGCLEAGNCQDTIDNDLDGQIDCDDSDCVDDLECIVEICGNKIDDNGDNLVDCDDPDCDLFCNSACLSGSSIILSEHGGGVIVVGNNIDPINNPVQNDFNGSCQLVQGGERVIAVTVLQDGILNFLLTGNNSDLSLYIQSTCGDEATEIACAENGPPNLEDPFGFPESESITNFVVSANQTIFVVADGIILGAEDFVELSVDFQPLQEICNDGIDDNNNGVTDCDDTTCFNDPICPGVSESICNDFFDEEDFDGFIDCQDTDCQALPECQVGNAPTGEPCIAASDCSVSNSNAPACFAEEVGFPGGYCSEFCDIFAPTCSDPNAICVNQGLNFGFGLCFDSCQVDADCRAEYFCDDFFGNGVNRICLPL